MLWDSSIYCSKTTMVNYEFSILRLRSELLVMFTLPNYQGMYSWSIIVRYNELKMIYIMEVVIWNLE
jgi:hypothetical protein